jgi:hypothetical protein
VSPPKRQYDNGLFQKYGQLAPTFADSKPLTSVRGMRIKELQSAAPNFAKFDSGQMANKHMQESWGKRYMEGTDLERLEPGGPKPAQGGPKSVKPVPVQLATRTPPGAVAAGGKRQSALESFAFADSPQHVRDLPNSLPEAKTPHFTKTSNRSKADGGVSEKDVSGQVKTQGGASNFQRFQHSKKTPASNFLDSILGGGVQRKETGNKEEKQELIDHMSRNKKENTQEMMDYMSRDMRDTLKIHEEARTQFMDNVQKEKVHIHIYARTYIHSCMHTHTHIHTHAHTHSPYMYGQIYISGHVGPKESVGYDTRGN